MGQVEDCILRSGLKFKGGKMIICLECRGAGFWWKTECELEVGARFSEPEKVICPKCKGTGQVENLNQTIQETEDKLK